MNFNPTADRGAGGAGGLGSNIIGSVSGSHDPDLGQITDLLGPNILGDVPPQAQAALDENPAVHSDPPWALIFSLAGAAVAVVTVYGVGRVSWNYGMGGLEGRSKMWAKVQRVAGWAGMGAKEAETPREWSRRLGTAIQREDDTRRFTDAYEEARYGPKDLQRVDDSTTRSAYVGIRNTLFRAVFRRGERKAPK